MGEIPENQPHAKSNNIFHRQATPSECRDSPVIVVTATIT
jgi:hypothetical protein